MIEKKSDQPRSRGPGDGAISRRQMLAGAAAVAIAASSPASLMAAAPKRPTKSRRRPTSVPAMRRFMSATAMLADGRILVTGGYDRPSTQDGVSSPLNSVMLLDPRTGEWTHVAPMLTPRARHAAVRLANGKIAVLGGLGMNPTASVEIYDPLTDTWEAGKPLAQPRFDHNAVSDGTDVYVLGGSSNGMLSSVEIYQAQPARSALRGRNK